MMFDELPFELIDFICTHLPITDILTLRRTNRIISNAVEHAYENHFRNVSVNFEPTGVHRLSVIASQPHVAERVMHIKLRITPQAVSRLYGFDLAVKHMAELPTIRTSPLARSGPRPVLDILLDAMKSFSRLKAITVDDRGEQSYDTPLTYQGSRLFVGGIVKSRGLRRRAVQNVLCSIALLEKKDLELSLQLQSCYLFDTDRWPGAVTAVFDHGGLDRNDTDLQTPLDIQEEQNHTALKNHLVDLRLRGQRMDVEWRHRIMRAASEFPIRTLHLVAFRLNEEPVTPFPLGTTVLTPGLTFPNLTDFKLSISGISGDFVKFLTNHRDTLEYVELTHLQEASWRVWWALFETLLTFPNLRSLRMAHCFYFVPYEYDLRRDYVRSVEWSGNDVIKNRLRVLVDDARRHYHLLDHPTPMEWFVDFRNK